MHFALKAPVARLFGTCRPAVRPFVASARLTVHNRAPFCSTRAMQGSGHDTDDPRAFGQEPPMPKEQQQFPGTESKMKVKPDYGYDTYVGHNKLKDKVAVVTGGDSGIGRAVCLAYAREGADVVISYLNEHEDAKETKSVVEEAGRQALLVAGDLSEDAMCQKVVDETVKKFGRIDILVNNAAFQGDQVDDFTMIDRQRLEFAFKTNIIAMFRLSQMSVPHMKPGSAIINTSSIQAYKPSPGILDYACTKGAIVAFTKGLGMDLFPKKGIRVNTVAPGPVWTPLIVESFPEEKVEKFGSQTPVNRAAQPKEYGPAFVFLACNEDSSMISGEVLGITGGLPLA